MKTFPYLKSILIGSVTLHEDFAILRNAIFLQSYIYSLASLHAPS